MISCAMGEGSDGVARVEPDRAGLDAGEGRDEAVGVHPFAQAVLARLLDERVVGVVERAGEVLLAADLGREDGGQEVVGAHALELRGDPLAAALPLDGEGPGDVPAPARAPLRHVEDGLRQRRLGAGGREVTEDLLQRERLGGADREHDGVVVGGGLQLEVEADAEALAQGEPPGAVDARAEGGVHDEMLVAGLIEEALEDDVRVRGDDAERHVRGVHVVEELRGAERVEAAGFVQHLPRRLDVGRAGGDVASQGAHLGRELDGAARRLAQPEGDRGGRALGVLDAHGAGLDALDAPGGGPEQEDVAGHALDGPVLVDGPDEGAVGLGDDAVVAQLGDRAAVGERLHARAAAGADDAVDAVVVDEGVGAAAALADAVAQHGDDRVEVVAGQVAVGGGATHEVEEGVGRPVLAGGLGDDLLRQHVERRDGLLDAVEAAGADGADQGGALDELVAGGGEELAARRQAEGVPGAADALQEGADGAGRGDLADEVDGADVDAQLQGGGRDERAQVAALEALLHLQAAVLGERAVVAGDVLLADPLGQVVGDALGQTARVDEDQRRAVAGDERGEAVVDLGPLLVRRDGRHLGVGQLDAEVEVALVAAVDDDAAGAVVLRGTLRPDQEARDLVDRALRGGEADAGRAFVGDVVEPGDAERHVAAAPVADEGVDLIDDEGADVSQGRARLGRREHQVERLGGGDEDVGRVLGDRLALGGRRVAAAHGDADGRQLVAEFRGDGVDLGQRGLEVAVDVGAEGLERGDVEDLEVVVEQAGLGLADQGVDAGQEGGQRLARPGGGGDEDVAAGADVGPAVGLGVGGGREVAQEPGLDGGVEVAQDRGTSGGGAAAGGSVSWTMCSSRAL